MAKNQNSTPSDPWYVWITNFSAPAGTNWIAGVRQFPDAAAYQSALGYTPETYFGHLGQTDAGYPTQAAAQAVANSFNGSTAPAAGGTPGGPGAPVAPSIPGLPNPFADVQSALSAFYDVLTNGKMWRSLGWTLLGIALVIAGLVLWIGPGALKASPYGRAVSAVRQAG